MTESQPRRAVIDTNVYISSFLRFNSIPSRAVLKAEWEAEILVSDAVLAEYFLIFRNPKFDKYVRREDRELALRHIQTLATVVEIPSPIRACRDPKDDKFLEVAVHGQADAILTGDADLLALHPFRGIAILSPADYLAME